jgi:hypothetical protein
VCVVVRLFFVLLVGLAVTDAPARAEIATIKRLCTNDGQTGNCPVYLPSFKVAEGWVMERNKTLELSVAMFVPKGRTFETTPVTMYAAATPLPTNVSLASWVAARDEKWQAEGTGAVVTEMSADDLGAGKRQIILHRYENRQLKRQAVEIVAYFVEKDAAGVSYAVRLVVSGVDDQTVSAARTGFDAMLKSY